MFTASPAFASSDCFELKTSKGGADLYIVDANTTVRVERLGERFDIGLQVESMVEKTAKRIEIGAKEAAELSGEAADEVSAVKVFLNYGQLVIVAKNKALIKDISGQTEDQACIDIRSSKLAAFHAAKVLEDKQATSVALKATSPNSLAKALGLS